VQGLRRADDAEHRERALQRLEAGIDRATRLVGQLMELARQQARQAEGAPAAPLDLVALARSVIAEALAEAQARSQELGLSGLDTAMVTGHADALRLLLRNLVENAIKYAPAGGRIEVGVRAGERQRDAAGRFAHAGRPARAPGAGGGLIRPACWPARSPPAPAR